MQQKRVVNMAIGCAIFSSLFLFQNCSTSIRGPQSLKLNSENAIPASLMEAASMIKSAANCILPQTGDSSAALQGCIDKTEKGGKLLLAPGHYTIAHTVEIKRSLSIGTSGTDTTLSANCETVACAEFSADRDVYGLTGFILVDSDDVHFDRLVIDGNRSQRMASRAADACRAGNNAYGYNISFHGNRNQITNSIFKNALCATGIYISGVSYLIQGNSVQRNGEHNISNMWSDGMTIGEMSQSKVLNNTFIDNTDVDLIFGACADCEIQNNKIIHGDSFATSSFAGLMIQAWPSGGTSGNYTHSDISGNSINCSAGKRCGFGLYVGASAWYKANIYGGRVHDNNIAGAQQGLAIDQVHDMEIYNNGVSGSGGTFLTSCGQKNLSAFVLTPGTVVDQSSDLLDQRNFLHFSVEGCIPNWWTAESLSSNPLPVPLPPEPAPRVAAPDTQQFVQQLYLGVLHRPADPSGLVFWSTLVPQRNSCALIANGIATSAEYLERKNTLSAAQVVIDLYAGILGRAPESPQQISERVSQLATVSFDQVISSITGSPEFKTRCHTFGFQ